MAHLVIFGEQSKGGSGSRIPAFLAELAMRHPKARCGVITGNRDSSVGMAAAGLEVEWLERDIPGCLCCISGALAFPVGQCLERGFDWILVEVPRIQVRIVRAELAAMFRDESCELAPGAAPRCDWAGPDKAL